MGYAGRSLLVTVEIADGAVVYMAEGVILMMARGAGEVRNRSCWVSVAD